MNRPEERLQRSVAEYLRATLRPDVFWTHVPNGGGRSKAEAGILKAMGVRAGVPDLLFVWSAKAFWIELKAPPKVLPSGKISAAKATPNPAQVETIAMLEKLGCAVAVCRSLDEVEQFLAACGIPTRGRVAV